MVEQSTKGHEKRDKGFHPNHINQLFTDETLMIQTQRCMKIEERGFHSDHMKSIIYR